MKNLYPTDKRLIPVFKQFFLSLIAILVSTYLLAQPVIHSFNPTSGPTGTIVTIEGANFSSDPSHNTVYFGTAKATVLSATVSHLRVMVPAAASYHSISVTTNRLTAFSNYPFSVTAPGPYNGFTSTSFSSKTDFGSGGYPNFISNSDIDGDGKSDLITLNNTANTLSIFRNTGGDGTLSLAPELSYPAGSTPFGAALGDLDGDNKPDIVIGDYSGNKIIIYKNNSTPGTLLLAEKIELISGLNPISIGILDIDLDGKPDIAAVNNNDHTVSVFKNTSTSNNISFTSKIDFAVGNWPQRLAISDLDGDKKPDLAVPNYNDNTLSILRNTSSVGTVSFATMVNLITGTNPFHVSVGDIDDDGKSDLVVANSNSGNISIYKNNCTSGVISFSTKTDFETNASPLFSQVTDLDGDGKRDIAVVNFGSNNISLFKNNSSSGVPSFEPKVNYATGSSPRVVTLVDLNGDGQLDMATVNSNSNTVSVFTNTMRAVPIIHSFTPASGSVDSVMAITGTGFSGTTKIQLGGVPVKSFVATATGINITVGDGATGDVVITTPQGVASKPGFSFQLPAPIIQSFTPLSGTMGTVVNIKGKYFSDTASHPIVYFGGTTATVSKYTDTTLTVTVPAGATYHPITVTANARTAYSSRPFQVTFPGSASGFKASSFVVNDNIQTPGGPRAVAMADFDNDGKIDVFVTNQSAASASIFKNNSTDKDIILSPTPELYLGGVPFGVAAGDLDGDGKQDIAVTNSNNGNAGAVYILRNNSTQGNITFTKDTTMTVGNGPHGIAIADLNADGKPEVVSTSGNSGYIAIYKNKSSVGSLSFDKQMNLPALNHSDFLTIADLDGDNKPEIISADFSGNTISIWRNTSSSGMLSFATSNHFAAGSFPVAVSAGDFDGDGKIDLVVANYGSSTVSVFKNLSSAGAISFASKQDFATGENPRFLTLGDMDGDGKTDIIVPYNSPAQVAVLKNKSTVGLISFAERIFYTTGTEPVGVGIGDLDADSKPDMVVPNSFSRITILSNRIDKPIITSFTPNAAETDSLVSIKGENFTTTMAVTFGNMAASFMVESDTLISAKVGTGSTGVVQVTTLYGSDTLGKFTYLPPVPVINTFSPHSGTVGTVIKISGKHFKDVQSIRLGNVNVSSYTIFADTLVTAVVGKGASGNLIATNPNGSDTLAGFTFIPPTPIINSFSPHSGTTATQVTIAGKNLTWTTDISVGNVKVNSFTINTDSTITAVIGDGGTGFIKLTSEFGTDTLGHFVFLRPETILAYPNPASGTALLAHPATNETSLIKLVDMSGKVIKTLTIPQNQTQTKVDLRNVQPGAYKVIWSNGIATLYQTIIVN